MKFTVHQHCRKEGWLHIFKSVNSPTFCGGIFAHLFQGRDLQRLSGPSSSSWALWTPIQRLQLTLPPHLSFLLDCAGSLWFYIPVLKKLLDGGANWNINKIIIYRFCKILCIYCRLIDHLFWVEIEKKTVNREDERRQKKRNFYTVIRNIELNHLKGSSWVGFPILLSIFSLAKFLVFRSVDVRWQKLWMT